MKLGRWQKSIIRVMRSRKGVANSFEETITTPDGQEYVPYVQTYGGRTARNYAAMRKALNGLIACGIIKRDGDLFKLNEKMLRKNENADILLELVNARKTK